jgi:hypothetical protein
LLRRAQRRFGCNDDHIDFELHELVGQALKSIELPLRPAKLDSEIAAIDVT